MKTITLSIVDAAEEAAVMEQIYEWYRRRTVRFESIDPLLFPGDSPLTPEEWAVELKRAEDSGTVRLTKEQALRRLGL